MSACALCASHNYVASSDSLLSLSDSLHRPLPPKLLFSQEVEDVAQRMLELDEYLKALLASPAVALSPLTCTFLDAVDCHSFRAQMLPALEQQYRMEQLQQGGELPPISDEVHFGQPAAPMVERAPKIERMEEEVRRMAHDDGY